MASSSSANDIYEIPLSTAIEWTTQWRQYQKQHKPEATDSKKAFRVDVAELQDVVNNIPGDDVQYVRFYLGLDENLTEHLVLVGVDANNNDICEFHGKTYTYDFSHPCPSICDVNSPLYNSPVVPEPGVV